MHIEPPGGYLGSWIRRLWEKLMDEDIRASATWNPGNLVADESSGAHMASKEVTVTGAELGDYVLASFSLDIVDLQLGAQVTTANTVTATLTNLSESAVDLGEGTLYIRVIKRTS